MKRKSDATSEHKKRARVTAPALEAPAPAREHSPEQDGMPLAPPALTRERRYGVAFREAARDWVLARPDIPRGRLAPSFWLLYRLWATATATAGPPSVPPPAISAEVLYGLAVRWVDEALQGRAALQRAAVTLVTLFDEVLAAAAADGLVHLAR